MITHIVLWKIDKRFTTEEKINVKLEIKNRLLSLPAVIPCIRHMDVQENDVAAPDTNFDICLYSKFDSMVDFFTYRDHPAHSKVGDYVKSVVESRAAIDF